MPLGILAEISLSTDTPQPSIKFFEALGFISVEQSRPGLPPHALLSDGRIIIGLYPRRPPFPALSFYALDLREQAVHIKQTGIEIASKLEAGDTITQLIINDPSGVRIRLAALPDPDPPPDGKSTALCGTFGEFSIPTNNLSESHSFWTSLGFEQISGHESEPYPYAILTDGLITVGLHQMEDFRRPYVTYFAEDMALRIKKIKRKNIDLIWKQTNDAGTVIHGSIRSPDGQDMYLFTGSI